MYAVKLFEGWFHAPETATGEDGSGRHSVTCVQHSLLFLAGGDAGLAGNNVKAHEYTLLTFTSALIW
jgi:hypothetical protein